MINLGRSSIDCPSGRSFRVRIVEVLRMTWVRRRKRGEPEPRRTRIQLGISKDDSVVLDCASAMVFPGFEECASTWSRVEFVLAGCGRWVLPPARHADFLVVREPAASGEIFEASNHMFWLTPDRLVELDGELAIAAFAGRHGDVVGNIDDALRGYVFDHAMETLTTTYGYDLDGEHGRMLIDVLTLETARANFLQAQEAVIEAVASRVSAVLSR